MATKFDQRRQCASRGYMGHIKRVLVLGYAGRLLAIIDCVGYSMEESSPQCDLV